MGILTDTAARTITFTVNGTVLPGAHAITHADGASDSLSSYFFTLSAGTTLQTTVSANATATTKNFLNLKRTLSMGGMV